MHLQWRNPQSAGWVILLFQSMQVLTIAVDDYIMTFTFVRPPTDLDSP